MTRSAVSSDKPQTRRLPLFFRLVAVRLFTAERTEFEHHISHVTSFSLIYMEMRDLGRLFVMRTSPVMSNVHAFNFFFCWASLLSSRLLSCPSISSSTMWRTNFLCTSADEDLGTCRVRSCHRHRGIFQAHFFTTVLLLCLMSSSFGLHDESPSACSHSSKFSLFLVSPVVIHNTCSDAFCGAFRPNWFSRSDGEAPLPPCFRKILNVTAKNLHRRWLF